MYDDRIDQFRDDPEARAWLLNNHDKDRKFAVEFAREDPAFFNEYVLRDERTGAKIRNAPYQEDWHDYMSDPVHRRLILMTHFEAGKSVQIAVGRTLWEIGRNTGIRIALIQESAERASETITAVAQHITDPDFAGAHRYHEVFPWVRAAKPWRPSTRSGGSITVERSTVARSPTLQGFGWLGGITGKRLDLVIADDWLTFKSTLTAHLRETGQRWFENTVLTRLVEDYEAQEFGRVVIVTNLWHPQDAHEEWGRNPGWTVRRYPLLRDDGTSSWPKRFPLERIEDIRQTMSRTEFDRTVRLKHPRKGTQVFDRAWFEESFQRGELLTPAWSIEEIHDFEAGDRVGVSFDLNTGRRRSKRRHLNSIVVQLHKRDGTRRLLWAESSDEWTPIIQLRKVNEYRRRYGTIYVESNQAQNFMLAFAHVIATFEEGPGPPADIGQLDLSETEKTLIDRYGTRLPIIPFDTGTNKWDPQLGVAAMSIDLANGLWTIPMALPPEGSAHYADCEAVLSEFRALMLEACDFDPTDPDAHTGDRLMSWWIGYRGLIDHWFEHRWATIGDAPGAPPKAGTYTVTSGTSGLAEVDPDKLQAEQLWSSFGM